MMHSRFFRHFGISAVHFNFGTMSAELKFCFKSLLTNSTTISADGRISAGKTRERTSQTQAPDSDSKTLEKEIPNDEHSQGMIDRTLSFFAMVNEATLDSRQLAIHRAHILALQAGDWFYTDPFTGNQVMTCLAHLHRGHCCGNACRHCPFGQDKVLTECRQTFNSAFYQ